MTAPISNQNPAAVSSGRTARSDSAGSSSLRREPESPEARAASDDSLTLSDAARRLAEGEGVSGGAIDEPDQALALLARLKEKMAENPGFAHAAHTAGAHSRLAALLENPA